MQKRDANDAGRSIAPLKAADDAVYIDSTSRDATAVVDEMMAVIRDTGRGKG
jgi:cytidylate kinase